MFVFGKRVVLGRSLAELNQFFRNISRWRSTFLWSTMKAAFLFALLLPTVFGASVDIDSKIRARCALSPQLIDEIRGYQPIVDKIIAAAVSGSFAGNTYRSLEKMINKFGARMTGSQSLEKAIDHVVAEMKAVELNNVHTQNVVVPHWERGFENAEMLVPRRQNIPILGLGSSIGTPPDGIVANIIAVESFSEFDALPVEKVTGKIVVFVPQWESYDKTQQYRTSSASVAARKGAAAVLVRSITPFSIGSVHTGGQQYDDGVRKIPAASISAEDAHLLLRLYRSGVKVTIRLDMNDRNLTPTISRNIIAEWTGELARPVVVVSGHLDSWDVGDGVMDDASGSFVAWKALQLLKSLGLKKPKRTMRAILWTAEEQDLEGANAYAQLYKDRDEEEFNFFMESDEGSFEPLGLDITGNAEAKCIMREVIGLMTPLNATGYRETFKGPDVELWTNRGFPGASPWTRNERYWWFHHSHGDSLLLQSSEDLDRNTALFAATAYVIADLSVNMPKNVVRVQ